MLIQKSDMREQTLYELFIELQQRGNHVEGYYAAVSLPFNKRYKIGISEDGYPMFFVPSTSTTFSVDINMEMITVLFGRVCKIHDTSCSEGVYTIITLKTGDIDIQKYFIDIVCIIVEQLPANYSDTTLTQEIQKLVNLFSQLSQPPQKTIQGLWSELLLIEQSTDPDYLIRSWHVDVHDKYDFNDGKDKLEVKSTIRPQRIHSFSIEQLNPNNNSNLIIASINTSFVGQGVNIFELRNRICSRVKDLCTQYHLNEVILKTIGNDISRISEMYFDYQMAVDSIAYYDARDIPCICMDDVPIGVSNVHFDSELSGISSIDSSKISDYQSALFNCICI